MVEPLGHSFNLSLFMNSISKLSKEAYILPLLKGGNPTDLGNYCPISKLSVVTKIIESLINAQLEDFFQANCILGVAQSDFSSGHSTSAALQVLNDIVQALDNKKQCAALFIDLSKAFDTANHAILTNRLLKIELSAKAVRKSENCLSDRSQSIHAHGQKSSWGVPQGSILGLGLFTIYINNIGLVMNNSPTCK
ncbi:hypothetical protein ANANG_G00010060 [Anguilla anguilla]|uniref:Reverse transcriptase domain-containing protein n=1 Tax=Anguilla anguilla TaxID=7936 RepID=A0A9D3MXS1_ANGAN|nr:hypothetical protein ANANG_G00010060 [Anguilla anguilla]